MGKAARAACIFTPWALTAASLVLLALVELSGWGGNHGELNDLYFAQANFSDFSVDAASSADNTTVLTAALEYAHTNGQLANIYQIHLWNYCSSNATSGSSIDYCSPRHEGYYFNPITVWGLNNSAAGNSGSGDSSIIGEIKNNTEAIEEEVLGKSGRDAIDAYRDVAHWMFIAYMVALWSTVATLVLGIFAIFSRIGSLLTWFVSIVSTIFTIAAVITSTVLFSILTGALHELLKPYNVHVNLGTKALTLAWIAAACSAGATFFWLFSACCCSGRSNPHHRSNKGGLWAAEKKGQGYDDFWDDSRNQNNSNRSRSLRVEQTGGSGSGSGAFGSGALAGPRGYERVSSPYLDPAHNAEYGDRVPLADYPQQTAYEPREDHHQQQQQQHAGGAYEPFRHV